MMYMAFISVWNAPIAPIGLYSVLDTNRSRRKQKKAINLSPQVALAAVCSKTVVLLFIVSGILC